MRIQPRAEVVLSTDSPHAIGESLMNLVDLVDFVDPADLAHLVHLAHLALNKRSCPISIEWPIIS